MNWALVGVLLLIILIAFYCYVLCEDRTKIVYEIDVEHEYDEDFIPSFLGYYETRTMNYPLLYPDPSVYSDYNTNNNYEATMYGASFDETPLAQRY